MRSFRNSLFFLLCLAVCLPFTAAAQWAPNGATSTSSSIYRSGKVGIGLSADPFSQLHVRQTLRASLPGQEVVIPPILRLQRDYNTGSAMVDGTYAWDFSPGKSLILKTGDGVASDQVLRIHPNSLDVSGRSFSLGYGGNNTNDNFRISYSNDFGGHFLAFNGTTYNGFWQGNVGKVAMRSDADGHLYFITGAPGGPIDYGQNERLTITPEGTTIIGKDEADQVLSIASEKNSILQFSSNNNDFQMLKNGMGDLEFWNGQNNTGSSTPATMSLKANGKLLIGTSEAPTVLNEDAGENEVNISDYRLFVEGGILTKEVRVRSVWADYVFADNYPLLPLPEVKEHIAENGHLHNTPSAAEIEGGGLELGTMMVNQQEKIEEIFLHLIQLNEQLAELKEENTSLRTQLDGKR